MSRVVGSKIIGDILSETRDRRVSATRFQGGQVEWSPTSPFTEEQVINHKLGRVPTGMWLIRQPRPLNWWATEAQVERWTDERVYFKIDDPGVVGSLSEDDVFVWQVF